MNHFDFLHFLRFLPGLDYFPHFFVMGGLLDLFSKKVNQTSTTNNTDNSRQETLTDSMNTWISQNASVVKADSRTYNSAFDAIDSFNTVQSFNIAGSTPLDPETASGFFTQPSSLGDLLNPNKISADPNANKYNFDFSSISAGGNDFLKNVQGVVKDTWEGLTSATNAAASAQSPQSSQNSSMTKTAIIVAAALLAVVLIFRRK